MKIVPKLQTAWSPLVLLSDNTRVNIPLVIKEEEYKLKPGEYLFVDKNTGDKTILKSKQATLSSDNRSDYLKRRDDERSKRLKRKYEEDKNTEAAMKQLSALGTFYSPSTWVGAATRNNDKSYFDNVASGEGFGDNATNLTFDLASPFLFNRIISTVNRGANFLSRTNSLRNTVLTNHLQGNKGIIDDAINIGVVGPKTKAPKEYYAPIQLGLDYSYPNKEWADRIGKLSAANIMMGKTPGYDGLKVTPLDKIDDDIYNIMDGQVFSRLGITTPEKFYSDIYQGTRSLMKLYDPKMLGINFPKGRIVIKEGVPLEYVLPHELRHRLDDMYPISSEQQLILNKAYGDDFSSDKIKKALDLDLNYDMSKEAVTTNLDARNKALTTYYPGFNFRVTTPNKLNEILDELADGYIVNAVENSNGYGNAYINYLIHNNLLTKDKIEAFRNAMKYVGIASTPIFVKNNMLK